MRKALRGLSFLVLLETTIISDSVRIGQYDALGNARRDLGAIDASSAGGARTLLLRPCG
jgi:hypothetical protein